MRAPLSVRLRRLSPDTDRTPLAATFADDATRLWNPGPDDLDDWLTRNAVDHDDGRTWAVADPVDDRLLGTVAVFGRDTEHGTAMIGYRTVPAERGRGVARAAVAAATGEAFAAFAGLHRIALIHSVGNVASCRVASAAGYALEGTTRSSWVDGDGRRTDEHLHACVRD